mgnify:CR=1 FL=1
MTLRVLLLILVFGSGLIVGMVIERIRFDTKRQVILAEMEEARLHIMQRLIEMEKSR